MIQWFRNRPILLKIFFVIFLFATIIYFMIAATFSHFIRSPKIYFRKIVIGSSHYILEDLAREPTLKKGRQLSQALGVQIRYEGLPASWTTSEKLPFYTQIEKSREADFFKKYDHEKWRPSGYRNSPYQISLRRFQDRFYLTLIDGENRFIVKPDFYHEPNLKLWLFILLVTLSAIFSLVYISLRRILSPIKELERGVQSVTDGNLELRLPNRSKDELGKLILAFNRMTQQVKELLFSKEQLLLDVSHELRSPLTRAKVAWELLPEGHNKERIKEDLDTMQQMLTELLESARLDSRHGGIELSHLDLVSFTQSLLRDYSDLEVDIEGVFPDTLLMIEGDRLRLEILLKNIIENALKYSDNTREPVRITLSKNNNEALLTIRDFGSGIPEKDLPFVLDPFYRVDKSRSKKTGGYGLGLSLCRKIVEAHGGKITIQSKINKGTTVSIQFPLTNSHIVES